MPTPFSHIVLAERMMADPSFPAGPRKFLLAQRPAFLLGNTAADLSSIADMPRHQTHFFRVPILRKKPAHLRLLKRYPGLSHPADLPPAQAAFVAGYLAHLWLDQAWILQIFQPFFAGNENPGSFHDRLLEHNLIRAQIDQEHRQELPPDLPGTLESSLPDDWLPFVGDEHIRHWRNYLSRQLAPGSHVRTSEVFAQRLGISTEQFTRRLHSEDVMENAFSRLPPNHLESFFKVAFEHSIELVGYYMEGQAESAPKSSLPLQQLVVGTGHGENAS